MAKASIGLPWRPLVILASVLAILAVNPAKAALHIRLLTAYFAPASG